MRRDEEEARQEQSDRKEIMELYKDLDQYNRDTWIIIGRDYSVVNYTNIMKAKY